MNVKGVREGEWRKEKRIEENSEEDRKIREDERGEERREEERRGELAKQYWISKRSESSGFYKIILKGQ